MRAKTFQIHWHGKQPIFSCHFEPNGSGRLATAGADHTVRIWKITKQANSPPAVDFLSSLTRHSAGVNVVRFAPQGEILASAGDDGNVVLWKQADYKSANSTVSAFACGGEDAEFHKETWRAVSILRGALGDLFDLAWSPCGRYIAAGSVDNSTIVWDAKESKRLHVLSYHTHFVQGIAWDPKGQYFATQSSDRSVNIYTYHVKPNGQFVVNLADKKKKMLMVQAEQDGRKSSQSTDAKFPQGGVPEDAKSGKSAIDAPAHMATKCSAIPRFQDRSRSPSQIASSTTPQQLPTRVTQQKQQTRACRLYADETLLSFFRRLTFAPDGNFLFTPAGEYNVPSSGAVATAALGLSEKEGHKLADVGGQVMRNTVYIYSRAGICRLPVAHLPGHTKPAVVVACSPVLYKLRGLPPTRERQLNPSEGDEATAKRSISEMLAEGIGDKPAKHDANPQSQLGSICKLPYRCVFAVATQDVVVIYDTQQAAPLVAAGNLHYASLTDLAWSPDGCTLVMTSMDGFCSILSFEDGELGDPLPLGVDS